MAHGNGEEILEKKDDEGKKLLKQNQPYGQLQSQSFIRMEHISPYLLDF